MARPTPHERRKADRLRQEIAAGVVKPATKQPHPLKDALRNVSRTATRKLDEAGVPDHLQTRPSGDWDINEQEREFNG